MNSEEAWAQSLDSDQFKAETARFKALVQEGTSLNRLLPKAFALAREAAKRTLGSGTMTCKSWGPRSCTKARSSR